ncbi:MAG: co-chaperone HscB [Gammaproteobacteria bacterium]|nr:co-chaperone HscB [Gammaproteobacteria bacterium]MDH5731570.1 co-chaperone HscB [Gammaproteobacteria bacterium]
MEKEADYFSFFGIEPSFELDLNQLSARYRELQKVMHPDRFAAASERERALSMQKASMINDAFQTLKNPLSRAKYLLQLNGHALDDENNTVMAPDFLMTQMDLHDQLGAIKQANDPWMAVADFQSSISQHEQALYVQFQQQIGTQQWSDAADSVRRLQFYNKLLHEAEAIEAQLD